MVRKRLIKGLAWAIAVAWALFTFAASNSPQDVRQKAEGWASFPIIRDLPGVVFRVAAHPVTLTISFLIIGIVLGLKIARWRTHKEYNPLSDLGVEMSLLAHELNSVGFGTDLNRLNAKISVVRLKAGRNGIRFPNPQRNYSASDLLPYLTHVSAYLMEAEIEHARGAAEHFANELESKAKEDSPGSSPF